MDLMNPEEVVIKSHVQALISWVSELKFADSAEFCFHERHRDHVQVLNFAESANLKFATKRNCDSLITSFQPPLSWTYRFMLYQLIEVWGYYSVQ